MSFLTLIHQGNGSLVEGADAQLVLGPFPTQQDAHTAGMQYLSRVDPQDTNNLFWTVVEIPSSQLTPEEALDELTRASEALGLYDEDLTPEEAEFFGELLDRHDDDDECEHDICQQTVPHDTVLPLQTAAEVYDEMEAEAKAPIWGVFSGDDVQQAGPCTVDEATEFIDSKGPTAKDYYIAKVAELPELKKETPEWLKEQDARPEHFRSSAEFFKNFGFD